MSNTRVTITECKTGGQEWVSEHRQRADAVDRACEKAFGKGAYLFVDNGLANIGLYGQIVRDMPRRSSGWQATCLTGRVKITVEEVS